MAALRSFISLNQSLTLAIAIASAGIITHLQWTKLQAQDEPEQQTKSAFLAEEKQIETNIALLKELPTLGYDNLVANWAFLDFIQYFGDDKARSVTGYSVTPKFFEVAIERDPLFLSMYPYLSSSVTLFSGNPTKSVALLSQGLNSIPDPMKSQAYFLWQAKATDELLFLGKPQDARQSYLKAAEWASRSSDPELQAVVTRSRQTAEFLAKNPDSRSAQVASWFNILTSAVDQRTQNLAVQQIHQLGGTVTAKGEHLQVTFPKD